MNYEKWEGQLKSFFLRNGSCLKCTYDSTCREDLLRGLLMEFYTVSKAW